MPAATQTPAALGFRMPAEWERQEAVWLSWPHNRQTWPGNFRPIPGKFAEIAAQISLREKVRINLAPGLRKRALSLIGRAGADMANVECFSHPTNDAWCRDHGPIFVRSDRTGEVAVTDWTYNAWGGKYPPYGLDNKIPSRVARALGLRRFQNRMVLEGGSIDVNGRGLLLTTEACLLNPNRNPGLTRDGIEAQLRAFLGVKQVLWLGEGIVGDDTDGHVDDITRFFSEDGIVTAVEKSPRDANYRPLQENLERLRSFRTPSGGRFRIAQLPMPAPARLPGPPAAGELRELPHPQRGRPHAGLPAAAARPRGCGDSWVLFPRPGGDCDRLLGTCVGSGHSPLHHPAAATAPIP